MSNYARGVMPLGIRNRAKRFFKIEAKASNNFIAESILLDEKVQYAESKQYLKRSTQQYLQHLQNLNQAKSNQRSLLNRSTVLIFPMSMKE